MSHSPVPARSSITMPAEPPVAADWRRNDIALYLTALLLLLLGWAVARQARSLAQSVDLGLGLPTVAYPAQWTRGAAGDALLYARNPASAGAYNATVALSTRPVLDGDTLDTVRAATGFQRNRTFDRYRELSALPVTVLGGSPGVLTTYASIADPTGQSGLYGVPVVVQGQDLIFRSGNQWVIASSSADATHLDEEADAFSLFFASFDLQLPELDDAVSATPSVPAPEVPAQGGFQGQSPSGVRP